MDKWITPNHRKYWIAGLIVVVVLVAFLLLRPKRLNGSYSAEISVFLMQTKDTMKFTPDGKVSEISDGTTTNRGTYKISGDDLQVNFKNSVITTKLAKDHQSFVIKSAPGIAALANGTQYTKDK